MLPDMSDVLTEWERAVKLKTVTITTVDFVEQVNVVAEDILAVVQVAEKEKLNPDSIDWSRRYIQVHSKVLLADGQFIEYQGADYKVTVDDNYTDYGYSEAVGEETKKALLVAT